MEMGWEVVPYVEVQKLLACFLGKTHPLQDDPMMDDQVFGLPLVQWAGQQAKLQVYLPLAP